MKIREVDVLRYLLDLVDDVGKGSSYEEPEGSSYEEPVNPNSVESPIDRDDVFVPPLQAKIEMMKKMTGVEQKNQDLVDQDDGGEPAQIGATPKHSVSSSLLAALEEDPFEG